jgi:hypothetical protein
MFVALLDRFLAVRRCGDHTQVVLCLEKGSEACTDGLLVIDDERADHRAACEGV